MKSTTPYNVAMLDDISDNVLKHRETCLTTRFRCFKRLHELQGSHIL